MFKAIKLFGIGLTIFPVLLKLLFGGDFLSTMIHEISCKSYLLISKSEENPKQLILTLTEYQNLEWLEENEFTWKNIRHDIIKTEVNAGIITITCVSDEWETITLNILEDHEEDDQEGTSKKFSKKWLQEEYLTPEEFKIVEQRAINSQIQFFYPEKRPLSFFESILLPPELV